MSKHEKNKNSGITLIALVVTIIVLLILAGISIQMLTGDNGIIKRAGEAKEKTERAQIIENARMDILEKIAENKGKNIDKTQLATILNKYFKKVELSVIPKEISNIHDVELITPDEKYNVLLSEIYEGKVGQISPGLYDENENLIYDWQTLLKNNYITVSEDNYINGHDADINKLQGRLIIDDSIIGIKENGLYGCSKLTHIELPNTLKVISGGGLGECSSLKELKLPDSISSVEGALFFNATSLEYLDLGNSDAVMRKLPEMRSWLFTNTTNLKEIIVGEGVKTIYGYTFRFCSANKIILPSTITKIEPCAFADCTNIENIDIPESVTYIGEQVFKNCTKLKKITIPENVTELRTGAFDGCSELEEIILPKTWKGSNTYLENELFINCTKLKSIKIPEGFTEIGYVTFKGCTNLNNIILPDSMRWIKSWAFQDCSNLKEIVIPENTTGIEAHAFENWTEEQTIYIKAYSSETESNFGDGWNGNAKVKWRGEF